MSIPPSRRSASSVRVLTWNIDQFHNGRGQQALVAEIGADVVMLQEVKGWMVPRLRAWHDGAVIAGTDLHPEGAANWICSAVLLPPTATVHLAGMVEGLPRPQRGVWVDADVPGLGRAHVVSWHGENAAVAGTQPRKMQAFRAVSAHLAAESGTVLLGGDLNTWRDPVQLMSPDLTDAFADEHAFVGPAPSTDSSTPGAPCWRSGASSCRRIRMFRSRCHTDCGAGPSTDSTGSS